MLAFTSSSYCKYLKIMSGVWGMLYIIQLMENHIVGMDILDLQRILQLWN